MAVPETSIRAWLQHHSNHQAFLGKPPPASPPPTPRQGPISTPPPQVQRNQALLERLRDASDELASATQSRAVSCDEQRSRRLDEDDAHFDDRSGHGSSPDAFFSDEGSPVGKSPTARLPQHRAASADSGAGEGEPEEDFVPRQALHVGPTPHRQQRPLMASPFAALFQSHRRHHAEDDDGVDVFNTTAALQSQVLVDMVAQLKWLHLQERGFLLGMTANATRSMQGLMQSHVPRGVEATTMTQPLVGFTVHEYVSSELRRVSTLEAIGRALIMSEQDKLRLEQTEYPAFRRTAQFTVAKLEKLFWKQERELRSLRDGHTTRATAGTVTSGRTSELSVSPLSPSSRDDTIDQLKALLEELQHVVVPALMEYAAASPAIDASAHDSLVAVVALLTKELQATHTAAVTAPPSLTSAERHRTSHDGKPPLSGGNTVRSPPPQSQNRVDMGSLVSSLIEQNQVLLEALQHAEVEGFIVPREVMEKLRHATAS